MVGGYMYARPSSQSRKRLQQINQQIGQRSRERNRERQHDGLVNFNDVAGNPAGEDGGSGSGRPDARKSADQLLLSNIKISLNNHTAE
jgi:hypothetical protein